MFREAMAIKCSIIRGGTSKGVFFHENDLPTEGKQRDELILRALGSPDIRQIDGLGGANSLTSKVCIIGPSEMEGADVNYTFGQVAVETAVIDWRGICGNLTAGVGIFAVDNNLVIPKEPFTKVRVYNTNTSKFVDVEVKVRDGKALSEGDFSIPGVPGKGSRIKLEFFDPSGAVTSKLLPTDNPKDIIDLGEKGKFCVSIVDAGSPVVYLKAEELGLAGTELPVEVENMADVLKTIEEIRSIAAEMTGIVKDRSLATSESPAFPKIGFVSLARDYYNPEGVLVKKEEVDLVARLASMQKMHRAYMIGGAISTAAASRIEGTIVYDLLSEEARNRKSLLIGHPYGPMEVEINDNQGEIISESVYRTARKIMEGFVFIPKDAVSDQ